MTLDEQHHQEADREWRDEERARRRPGVRGPAGELPQPGERFTIRWPGAEHDFEMLFEYEDRKMCGSPPGWTFLHGRLVEPESWRGWHWSFMVHFVDGEWTMLPKNGKLSDVQSASTEIDSTPEGQYRTFG